MHWLKSHHTINNVSLLFPVAVSQDEELARQLVELGYRGSGEVSKISLSFDISLASETQG